VTALTIAGGLYLIWLGAKTVIRPTAPAITAGGTPSATGRAALARGIGVSGLNPKGLLVILAILPQFTSQHNAAL
jgi:threonine/homoserine/homoserine lactone efflux protein